MGKKKLEKAVRKVLAERAQANESGSDGKVVSAGTAASAGTANAASGLLSGLGLSKLSQNQQFLLGAFVGAAATYVMTDEAVRGKIMKGAMKLYADMAGGFEEMREQMADLRAEAEAERGGEEI